MRPKMSLHARRELLARTSARYRVFMMMLFVNSGVNRPSTVHSGVPGQQRKAVLALRCRAFVTT